MTARVFPPHIKTPAEAHDYLLGGPDLFGGLLRDGITAQNDPGGAIDIDEFHIDFPTVDTVLTVGLSFDSALDADFYKFDLRRGDGTLLWREDCHEGHEHEHGGTCHLHTGPRENVVAANQGQSENGSLLQSACPSARCRAALPAVLAGEHRRARLRVLDGAMRLHGPQRTRPARRIARCWRRWANWCAKALGEERL